MKRRTILSTILGVAGLLGLAAVDAHADGPQAKTYYSRAERMGDGSVRTYVTLASERGADENGGPRVPAAVGIELTGAALRGLPSGEADPWIIDLPIQAKRTPFQYAMIDWNPEGHPPAMYQLPHFDFHFYIQDLDEVMNIKPGPCSGLNCDDFAKATKPVPAQYMPAGYIDVGAVEPYMGNHLIDPTSPEFNGEVFTRTFIYGAYDGKITFEEAMITQAFLLSHPKECKAYPQAQAVDQSGYWPTQYCTTYDAKTDTYRISLERMTYRNAQ